MGVSVLIGLTLWLLSHRRNTADSQTVGGNSSNVEQRIAAKQKSQLQGTDKFLTIDLTSGLSPDSDTNYAKFYLEHRAIDRLFDWQRPINFFGKVLDEQAQPIEGAQVHFVWNDISEKGSSEVNTMSDAQGMFSLTGIKGKGLSVSITKKGM